MTDKNNKQSSTINVQDKRSFHSNGTPRHEETEKEQGKKEPDKENKQEKQSNANTPPNIEINFSTFILSLASSVQISLGLIPHPMTQKSEVNLVSAKQTIDILEMMEEKTKGNLKDDEDRLLKQILFELRMQYVEVSKKSQDKTS